MPTPLERAVAAYSLTIQEIDRLAKDDEALADVPMRCRATSDHMNELAHLVEMSYASRAVVDEERLAEIISGLEAGEAVVLSPPSSLEDGDRISEME